MNRVGLIAALVAIGPTAVTAVAQEPQATPDKPVVVQHDVEGRAACLACHGGAMEAIPGVPASHTSRTNDTCLWCHAADAEMQTTDPKTISHALEGRSACLMCHAAGVMEAIPDVPPSHEGRTDAHCTLCHETAEG